MHVVTGDPQARFVLRGPVELAGRGASVVFADVPPGDYALCFAPPPVGTERPAALPLSVRDGADIDVATTPRVGTEAAVFSDSAPMVEPAAGERTLFLGPESVADAHAAVSWRAPRAGRAGLLFRWSDADNHYRFGHDAGTGRRWLERIVDGEQLVLHEERAPTDAGRWHRIECQAVGFVLQVAIDGLPFCTLLDGAHVQGRVGLWWADCDPSLRFADFEVRAPLQPTAVLAARREGLALALAVRSPADAGRRCFLALTAARALVPPGPAAPGDALLWSTLTGTKERAPLHGSVGDDGAFGGSLSLPELAALRGFELRAGGWIMDATDAAPQTVLPIATVRLP